MMESLRRLIFAVFVLALALALFGIWRRGSGEYGLLNFLRGEKPSEVSFTPPVEPSLDLGEVELLARLDGEYSKLAASVLPSVVSVTTKTVRQGGYGWHPFFGLVGTQAQVIPGLGSGAIISKEGHVVTNFHVIEGVNEVMVTTQDKKSYPARFLGANRQRDIAVLKIDSNRKDFPALRFADSDAVKVGQLVLAVGNPFGLSGTVTRGIISARDRHLSDSSLDYLQTDAVINPGNSGGPLVNVRGEILGINVAIYRGDENVRAWQGVGLAVPAKDAEAVIKAVLNQEQDIEPGYLGLEVAAETVRLEGAQGPGQVVVGALVTAVMRGSPAAVAGILPGDVVVAFQRQLIESPSGLLKSIRSLRPGQEAVVRLVREGQELEVAMRVAKLPLGK
jgi:S1-C subfamily serine protease